MQANGASTASTPCGKAGNRGGEDAAAGRPTVLRKLVCWWQEGLSRQSYALIP